MGGGDSRFFDGDAGVDVARLRVGEVGDVAVLLLVFTDDGVEAPSFGLTNGFVAWLNTVATNCATVHASVM